MKTPLLIAAVCAGLPGCAAPDTAPATAPGTEAFAARCDAQGNAPRAASALPARASTGPAPQLGTVAPSTRLPAHVETPSMRAMARVTAAQAAQSADGERKVTGSEKTTSAPCPPVPGHPAPQGGAGHS